MKPYKVLVHDKTYKKTAAYLKALQEGKQEAGAYLYKKLKNKDKSKLSVDEFIELIVQTKKPQIFAESAVSGNGSDWTQLELEILGDINIAVPVVIYDNGLHYNPVSHNVSFDGTLLYTPGALLRNGRGSTPVDWVEVVKDGQLDYKTYYMLYERRLLPILAYANAQAKLRGRNAFITIPGLGCGMFAGKFQGQLGAMLEQVLIELLEQHGEQFSNIKAIYYDPYKECSNKRLEINGISFFVRPLTQGNQSRPQLCQPQDYEETGDDFSTCDLFSLVAWDHVSWPGNDFYIGSRATDDGVKAAATSSMLAMTGVQGVYNPTSNCYEPPKEYRTWNSVIIKNNIEIQVVDNLEVFKNFHTTIQKQI